jgi:hypothetical protein
MPGNGLNFHHIQVSIFEEATGGFMAQVMEAQVLNPGFFRVSFMA